MLRPARLAVPKDDCQAFGVKCIERARVVFCGAAHAVCWALQRLSCQSGANKAVRDDLQNARCRLRHEVQMN